MKIIILLSILLLSCKKEISIQQISVYEDSASMKVERPLNLEYNTPAQSPCIAGAYTNTIYNQDLNSSFQLKYGYDGTNITYGNMDAYTGAYEWLTYNKDWQPDYLGAWINGFAILNTIRGVTYHYNLHWWITPQTCMLHYSWQKLI